MVAVEKWQEGHEDVCAVRYAGIEAGLTALKSTMNKAIWLVVTVLIAVLGWMAVQLYNGMQEQIHQPAPVVAVQRATRS